MSRTIDNNPYFDCTVVESSYQRDLLSIRYFSAKRGRLSATAFKEALVKMGAKPGDKVRIVLLPAGTEI